MTGREFMSRWWRLWYAAFSLTAGARLLADGELVLGSATATLGVAYLLWGIRRLVVTP